MSIVVTCACAMTYRLPDRYAGKRCRCRECGGAIKVPREGAPQRKKPAAKRTTRRVASHEQEIQNEQRALRGAKAKIRPVSESMHQLSPLDMSRALEAPEALAPRKRREEKARRDAPIKAPRKPRKQPKPPKARAEARRGREDEAEERPRKTKGTKPAKKARQGEEASAAPAREKAPARGRRTKDETGEGGKKGKKSRETRAAETARPKGRPGTRSGTRARRDEEDGDGGRRRDPVKAALIIAAVLCLAVGLTLGVALTGGGNGGGGDTAAKLASALETVQALKAKREWTAARGALAPLVAELDAAGLAADASKVRSEMRTLDALAQLSAIEDDDARLATLLDYARNPDAAVRLGVTHELRSLSGQPEAQDALAGLARDSDARVAESARQGLIAAGGPHAIPFLAQAIADAAATGGKQGEIALQRALELDDPQVVPVLAKAIEVRPDAPAATLKAILRKLRDLGESGANAAIKTLTAHADPEVKKLAEETLADLGG